MNVYFSENLKNYRKESGLTQEKLADYLGIAFQTISKWERGETYPDITMLPEIASFFKVSVDDLLGVNRAESKKEIEEQLYIYDNLLTDREEKWELISSLKKKFSNDYRVLLRYMSYHIHYTDKNECDSLVQTIYENIIDNCTDDDIRICAKRHIVQHYRNLSSSEDSKISFDDVEKVLSTMPYMRDGKDFISCYVYPERHPQHYDKSKEAVEELLGLLDCALEHCHVWEYTQEHSGIGEGDHYLDYNICLIETMNTIFDMFYDKNYGRQWRYVIRNYLHLGYLYSLKGDCDHAVASFRKAAELAKELDALDEVTVLESRFLNGREFKKKELGSASIACSSVKKWIEARFDQYPKELLERKNFDAILAFLDNQR